MRNTIWVFLCRMFRHYCGYIVFITSLIDVITLQANSEIFTINEDELAQLELLEHQVKEQFNSYISKDTINTQSFNARSIDSTSTPLLEQTYIAYQTAWNDFFTDALCSGTNSYLYKIYNQNAGYGRIYNNFYKILTAQTNMLFNLPLYLSTTTNQLGDVISKLDKLAGDDGNGNANINVNFQPLQQTLDQLKLQVQDSNDHLSNISMALTPDIKEDVNSIANFVEHMESNQAEIASRVENVKSDFNYANDLLHHIDTDFHQLLQDGITTEIDWEAGGGTNYLDEVIGKHFDKLTEDMERIADEQTKPEKLDGEYMDEAYDQEQGAYYVMNTMLGAKDQLQSELSQIHYTNINAKVYDYDEYNNYYTLQEYEANPMSNDQFIREKVQQYIDQVTYTTETIRGQVTTRLDELKQSTLLTTDYDSKWLVVKKGALSEKWDFPKKDWEVDFADIKLESNIAKTIYDWIYYLLAVVIIYKQFSKVV